MLQAWAYWNSHGSLTYAWVMVECQCSLMEVCMPWDWCSKCLGPQSIWHFCKCSYVCSLDFIIWPISCCLLIFGALNSSCRLKILSVNVCFLSVWSASWGLLSSCWTGCGTKPSFLAWGMISNLWLSGSSHVYWIDWVRNYPWQHVRDTTLTQIGRPIVFALACDGEAGLKVLQMLREEF